MKRGKPLQRKTPLVAKKPLAPGKGLQAKSAPKNGRASTGPARDVVDAVAERAGHSCEICSAAVGPTRGVDFHIHHRRPRAAGGSRREDTNLPSNLLLLCPPCHEAIESRRGEALAAGWLVPQNGDPEETAVVLFGDRIRYLTATCEYSPHPPRWKEGEAP